MASNEDLKQEIALLRQELQEMRVNEAKTSGRLNQITDSILTVRHSIDKVDKDKVSTSEFSPVQKIIYGLVGIVLTAFLVAILTGITKAGSPEKVRPYTEFVPNGYYQKELDRNTQRRDDANDE